MQYKAFLSSTFRDLEAHREYAIEQMRKAGFQVVTMEDWGASAAAPRNFAPERVTQCDLVVLLVAGRRGHKPEGSAESITQSEYRAAVNAEIDVLPFLLDDEAPWYPKWDERKEDPELAQWRKQITENHGIDYFGLDADSLPIGPALTRWLGDKKNDGAEQNAALPPVVRGVTKVLILGRSDESSLSSQFRDSLSTLRSVECSIESKDSPEVARKAQEAHVIIVTFRSTPDDVRERDAEFLRALRPWEDNLLLFAKNREDLMDVLDEIRLTPDSVFKVKSPEDSERRLLARLFDWNYKHTAMVSSREAQQPAKADSREPGAAAESAAGAPPNQAGRQGTVTTLLRVAVMLAVAATIWGFVSSSR